MRAAAARLALAFAVAAAASACTGKSSAAPEDGPSTTPESPPPASTHQAANRGAPAHDTAPNGGSLVGIGDAGTFDWRCAGRDTRVSLHLTRATDAVRIRNNGEPGRQHLLQPGHEMAVRIDGGTTAVWMVVQDTEQRKLVARVRVAAARTCVRYVPPKVALRTNPSSH